jgi:hypothetical protein
MSAGAATAPDDRVCGGKIDHLRIAHHEADERAILKLKCAELERSRRLSAEDHAGGQKTGTRGCDGKARHRSLLVGEEGYSTATLL